MFSGCVGASSSRPIGIKLRKRLALSEWKVTKPPSDKGACSVSSIQESAQVLQHLLGAVALEQAERSGFCQRRSKLSGSSWVWGLVLGWLSNPQASLCALAQATACAGAVVSPQALEQRFNEAGAALLCSKRCWGRPLSTAWLGLVLGSGRAWSGASSGCWCKTAQR